MLIFTLTDRMLFELLEQKKPAHLTDEQKLFSALHFYDLRGGGLVTQNKSDKQAWVCLGVTSTPSPLWK